MFIPSGSTFTAIDETQYYTGLKSMIAGATVEFPLPSRFSVEIDALHKSLRDQVKSVLSNGTTYPTQTYTAVSTWQFPVLAKYRLTSRRLRPFLEAGPAFRMPNQDLATYDATGGGGIETQWHAIHIAPAVRFTRWAGGSKNYQHVRRNAAALVVGVSLGGPRTRSQMGAGVQP